MMYLCGLIGCNKCTALVESIDNAGGDAFWRGQMVREEHTTKYLAQLLNVKGNKMYI